MMSFMLTILFAYLIIHSLYFVTPLLFPSSITSCRQHHASCLNSWKSMISTLRLTISEITNTLLLQDDMAWAQATLPRVGGLEVYSASVLAPSAYLSSSAATADLVHTILPATHSLYLSFL